MLAIIWIAILLLQVRVWYYKSQKKKLLKEREEILRRKDMDDGN